MKFADGEGALCLSALLVVPGALPGTSSLCPSLGVHIKKKSLLCFWVELFENIQDSGIYILTLKISPREILAEADS